MNFQSVKTLFPGVDRWKASSACVLRSEQARTAPTLSLFRRVAFPKGSYKSKLVHDFTGSFDFEVVFVGHCILIVDMQRFFLVREIENLTVDEGKFSYQIYVLTSLVLNGI
jgi:hypothetical protein